jgi:hypothetical protein
MADAPILKNAARSGATVELLRNIVEIQLLGGRVGADRSAMAGAPIPKNVARWWVIVELLRNIVESQWSLPQLPPIRPHLLLREHAGADRSAMTGAPIPKNVARSWVTVEFLRNIVESQWSLPQLPPIRFHLLLREYVGADRSAMTDAPIPKNAALRWVIVELLRNIVESQRSLPQLHPIPSRLLLEGACVDGSTGNGIWPNSQQC